MQVLFTDPNRQLLGTVEDELVMSGSQQHLSSISLTFKLQKQYSSFYMLNVLLSFVYLASVKISKTISPLTNILRKTKNKIKLIILMKNKIIIEYIFYSFLHLYK